MNTKKALYYIMSVLTICVLGQAIVLFTLKIKRLYNEDIRVTYEDIHYSKPTEETSVVIEETQESETYTKETYASTENLIYDMGNGYTYVGEYDASSVFNRIDRELNVFTDELKLQLQMFVDSIEGDSKEHEFLTSDMINIRNEGDKKVIYISGYNVPGFNMNEILLFYVFNDGSLEYMEDWAELDYYLERTKEIRRLEKNMETIDISGNNVMTDRATGTIHQSYPNKIKLEGYEAIDSREFDDDDYCDTVINYNAYTARFSSFVGANIEGFTIEVGNVEQASLDLWNFSNAFAIPLTYDKYRLKVVHDTIIGGVHYNLISISGDATDDRGTYGKYIMLVHSENGVVYSDFYIWEG